MHHTDVVVPFSASACVVHSLANQSKYALIAIHVVLWRSSDQMGYSLYLKRIYLAGFCFLES
jgi:hypothetical protein